MKKILLLIAMCVSGYCGAQTIKVENVNINDPRDIVSSVPDKVAYTFAAFTDGTVYFKDGSASRAKLNYNLLIEELQFLDKDGTVFALATPNDVRYVLIGDKIFYQYEGRKFVEMLINADVALCIRRRTECVGLDGKIGAYGQASSTSAISQVNSAQLSNQHEKLAIRRDLLLKVSNEFYLRKAGKYIKMSKKAILKTFPNYKNQINEYFERKNVDMTSEKDLSELIFYCNQLKLK